MRGTVEGRKERFLRLQKECVERRRNERKKERERRAVALRYFKRGRRGSTWLGLTDPCDSFEGLPSVPRMQNHIYIISPPK